MWGLSDMSIGLIFIIIAIIVVFILEVNNHFSSNKFIKETEPYFKILMEDDYEFLLRIRYGSDIDVEKMYGLRVRNGIVGIIFCLFIFLQQLSFAYVLLSLLIGLHFLRCLI